MALLDDYMRPETPTPQVFKVKLAGGEDEPPHPEGASRWYSVDGAGVLTVVTQTPEGTTTARYSPAAWESVTEFAADPTYRPTAEALLAARAIPAGAAPNQVPQ